MIHPWHQSTWQQLQQHRASRAHALLLHGRQHTGKTDFARHYAQTLLCETPDASEPCGQCPACHLFSQNSHPDFHLLTPEIDETDDTGRKRAQIKIDAVRQLMQPLLHSSVRGGLRVVLVAPAEALNLQAANALLKILEEPPPAVVFLLLSHNKDQLLPTIKSRCRQLLLPAPSVQAALGHLKQQHPELSDEQAAALSALHGHVPFCQPEPEQDALHQELCQILTTPRLLAILDFAARFERSKYPLALLLEWLQKWLTDLALVQQNLPPQYHPPQHPNLLQVAQRTRATTLFALEKTIRQLSPYGRHTLNVKMQTESLLTQYLAFWQNKGNTP